MTNMTMFKSIPAAYYSILYKMSLSIERQLSSQSMPRLEDSVLSDFQSWIMENTFRDYQGQFEGE